MWGSDLPSVWSPKADHLTAPPTKTPGPPRGQRGRAGSMHPGPPEPLLPTPAGFSRASPGRAPRRVTGPQAAPRGWARGHPLCLTPRPKLRRGCSHRSAGAPCRAAGSVVALRTRPSSHRGGGAGAPGVPVSQHVVPDLLHQLEGPGQRGAEHVHGQEVLVPGRHRGLDEDLLDIRHRGAHVLQRDGRQRSVRQRRRQVHTSG